MSAEIHDLREFLHVECDCVPDLGPAHCHECSRDDPNGDFAWPCRYADSMAQYLAQVRAEARRGALREAANERDEKAGDADVVSRWLRALADKETP